MTKKWLWYVCIGLICCSSIAFVYAKQTTGVSKARTDRNALIEQYESVISQIKANGESPELTLLEAKLRAKLYPESRQRVSNATIEKLANGANNLAKVEQSNAPMPTNYAGAPTELEAAKAAYERMLYGEMLSGDKALIEANFPEPEATRTEHNYLDDNGGTWFSWTGNLAIADLTCLAGGLSVPISVAGLGNVLDIEVRIDSIRHTWDSDLRIWLVGPTGAVCSLSTANGGSGDNYVRTVFDDEAACVIGSVGCNTAPFTGNYRPEGLLSVFDGLAANGSWTLRICDGAGGDIGTLTGWSLQVLATAGGQVPELVVSQLSPCGNQEPNGAAPVSMRVSNVGPVASPATTARFTFDSGVTTDLLAVPPIAPSSFFDVFFAVPVNVTLGAHTLKGYVDQVAGDATQTNDTSACNITASFCYDFTADLTTLPYSHTFTTVGAGDNCALRAGADVVYQVIVPVAGNYTFSTCNTAAGWDAYMYITSACCGGTTLAFDDDACNTAAGFMPLVTCLSLAAGTYYVDIEPYSSGSTGPYTLDISACLPCDVVCDPGDVSENAPTEVPDSTFMTTQDPNGGCNNSGGPLFGAINCGETVCGIGFNYVAPGGSQYRDTDWYLFTLTEWDTVKLTCTAEYNALFGIVTNVSPCNTPAFVVSNTTTAQCTTRTVQTCLAPGTYAAFCATSGFSGVAYGTNPNYRLGMTCVPCTPPTGRCCYVLNGSGACAINNSLECANLGGVWTSGITDCITSPCPTGRCCYLDVNNQPACLIDQQAVCTALGGTWTSGVTDCIASPCAVGRCCYNAGAGCENTTAERCTFLEGTWSSTTTCEATPCPVPPTNDDCQTATTVAIPQWCSTSGYFVQLDLADTTCPETVTGDGITIPEYTSTAGDAFFQFTLTECRRIAIVASGPDATNIGHDSHISVKDACCGATFILGNDDYNSNDSLPVYTAQGWLPATTRPLNTYGSMVAGPLPAGTYYVRAGVFGSSSVCSYTLTFYDYGPCVAPNLCGQGDLVTDLTVHRDALAVPPGSEAFVTLRWTNTNAGDYNVWSSTNPANDGDPDGPDSDLKAGDDPQWTLETLTPLSLPAGAVSWDRPAGFEPYINFVVTPDCDPTPPTGRCCYVSGNQYACATVTEAQCNILGGNWTIYLSCDCASNPCPQNGRCCYLDVNNQGTCTDNLEADCALLEGVWTAGVSCATAPCEIGRCCYLNANNQGACADVQELECNFLGGTWTAGLTCATDPCVTAACCYNAGTSCGDLQDIECAFLGGTWYAGEACATFTCPQPPANDDCGNAITVTNGVTVNGDNTAATGVDPTSCGFNSDLDVWYVYTPTALTAITVTTCDPVLYFDSNVSLWTACTGGTELACNEDDFNTNCMEYVYSSWLQYTPTTLDPIYIRVAGWNGDFGPFALTVTQ